MTEKKMKKNIQQTSLVEDPPFSEKGKGFFKSPKIVLNVTLVLLLLGITLMTYLYEKGHFQSFFGSDGSSISIETKEVEGSSSKISLYPLKTSLPPSQGTGVVSENFPLAEKFTQLEERLNAVQSALTSIQKAGSMTHLHHFFELFTQFLDLKSRIDAGFPFDDELKALEPFIKEKPYHKTLNEAAFLGIYSLGGLINLFKPLAGRLEREQEMKDAKTVWQKICLHLKQLVRFESLKKKPSIPLSSPLELFLHHGNVDKVLQELENLKDKDSHFHIWRAHAQEYQRVHQALKALQKDLLGLLVPSSQIAPSN